MATEDGIVYKLAYHAGKYSLARLYFNPLPPSEVRAEAEEVAAACAASEAMRAIIVDGYLAGYNAP